MLYTDEKYQRSGDAMKKYFLPLLLALVLLLSACAPAAGGNGPCAHADGNDDAICDLCSASLLEVFDFYTINDLHGKLDDADSHPGVDELTTFLKNARSTNTNSIFLSAGDMWQGSSESNLTGGLIMTEWMNELGFTSMTLGNHEYDWGSDAIRKNAEIAQFPLLAINIYDRETGERAEYCQPSTVVERSGLQIGIIGAMGDCYSSIATDKSGDVYFKVGKELTAMVKDEADRLRDQGVDFIVYVIHDGYEKSRSGSVTSVSKSDLSSYYDTSLSDGYVDLVFEGHTHQGYRLVDEYGVYHLQHRGDNKGGISHARVMINRITGSYTVRTAELITTDTYSGLEDDPIVDQLLEKYQEQISQASKIVGYNDRYLNSDAISQLVADCYYRAGVEKWGDQYEITLGGALVSVRSPGYLSAGYLTYGELQTVLPFDNVLTLCSIKGSDLNRRFLETTDTRYYICTGDYGTIDPNGTYYIITDSYSAYYAPNKLTVIEEYGDGIFARDLLADYFAAGKTPGDSDIPGGNGAGDSVPDPDPVPEEKPTVTPDPVCTHADANKDDLCDLCRQDLLVIFDIFTINDLHGKLDDADTHPGVDELTTYLKNALAANPNTIFLSTGDMWQGSSESNLTGGLIMTDWMNSLGFSSMTLGNHEYDWGSDAIRKNAEAADFPLLAINIYDRQTNQRVDYCQASTVVDRAGLQIGIIGAMGDCYSSIATDKSQDVYFKTGSDLTKLVKDEADRLRAQGVDLIVYVLHDGYGSTSSGVTSVSKNTISSYYDTSLSNGYVDVVFEGHTHQGYRLVDEYGVYHLQNRGDNKGGISHVNVAINCVTGDHTVRSTTLVSTSTYSSLPDDPIVDQLLEKYEDQISLAYKVVGYNSRYRSGSAISQLVADCYYQFGLETWGDQYKITLGGGYISTRSPGYLEAGDVTYGDLQTILPFDNGLTLCSIKGSDLLNKFINSSNSNYYISDNYGSINRNATYYIVTDSYTAYYSPNKLTVIEEFDPGTYARDLLADYISAGGLN